MNVTLKNWGSLIDPWVLFQPSFKKIIKKCDSHQVWHLTNHTMYKSKCNISISVILFHPLFLTLHLYFICIITIFTNFAFKVISVLTCKEKILHGLTSCNEQILEMRDIILLKKFTYFWLNCLLEKLLSVV